MKRATLACYVFFLIFSLAGIFWFVPKYSPEFTGFGMPPAALPLTLCAVMLVFSIPVILKTLRLSDERPTPVTISRCLHVAGLSSVFFATMPTLHFLGFLPGGIAVLSVLQFLCGQRNPLKLLLVSCASTGFIWACMTYVLKVPMP